MTHADQRSYNYLNKIVEQRVFFMELLSDDRKLLKDLKTRQKERNAIQLSGWLSSSAAEAEVLDYCMPLLLLSVTPRGSASGAPSGLAPRLSHSASHRVLPPGPPSSHGGMLRARNTTCNQLLILVVVPLLTRQYGESECTWKSEKMSVFGWTQRHLALTTQ
ncbi:hypothetical protein J6590_052308 [Homalodisca vitripennis]|nr:hypothetical protein J6590_052308 [Homalodisca vitripennis]